MSHKVWAGIGSRETPSHICEVMSSIGSYMASLDWFLRTGAARGADQAFASGVAKVNAQKTILYLPWSTYEQEFVSSANFNIGCTSPTLAAIRDASIIHPNWAACGQGAQKLHGRNMHILAGKSLMSKVAFVIYYSQTDIVTGGTALGVKAARNLNIPVYNIRDMKDTMTNWVDSIIHAFEIRMATMMAMNPSGY